MKLALSGGKVYIRNTKDEYPIVKGLPNAKYNKKLQAWEVPATADMLDRIQRFVKLPPALEQERVRLRRKQERIDAERLNDTPTPLVEYPVNIYMQILYMIKGYHDLRAQREKLLSDLEQHSLLISSIEKRLKAIDQAIAELRGKYAKTYTDEEFDAYEAFIEYSTFCYYRSNPKKNTAPCKKTWIRYRGEFIYLVSKNMYYL